MFNEVAYADSPDVGTVPARGRRSSRLADFAFDWGAIVDRGIRTAPAIISAARQPYPSYAVYDGGAGGIGASGQTKISPTGISSKGGFNISTNTLVIGGLVLAIILLTRKR